MPGALIEPLFVTDPYEGTLAASTSGQEVIAGGLAQAIEQYLAPAPPDQNSESSTRRSAPEFLTAHESAGTRVECTAMAHRGRSGHRRNLGARRSLRRPDHRTRHALSRTAVRHKLGSSGTPPIFFPVEEQPLIVRPRVHPDAQRALAAVLVLCLALILAACSNAHAGLAAPLTQRHRADRAQTRPGRRPPRRPRHPPRPPRRHRPRRRRSRSRLRRH